MSSTQSSSSTSSNRRKTVISIYWGRIHCLNARGYLSKKWWSIWIRILRLTRTETWSMSSCRTSARRSISRPMSSSQSKLCSTCSQRSTETSEWPCQQRSSPRERRSLRWAPAEKRRTILAALQMPRPWKWRRSRLHTRPKRPARRQPKRICKSRS